jgi:hypothetical protein
MLVRNIGLCARNLTSDPKFDTIPNPDRRLILSQYAAPYILSLYLYGRFSVTTLAFTAPGTLSHAVYIKYLKLGFLNVPKAVTTTQVVVTAGVVSEVSPCTGVAFTLKLKFTIPTSKALKTFLHHSKKRQILFGRSNSVTHTDRYLSLGMEYE